MKRVALMFFMVLILNSDLVALESDKVIINDIENWNHPVKKVMELYNVKLSKIQLLNNKTYPVFYAEYPCVFDANWKNRQYFASLIRNIAVENGYWDFQLIDIHRPTNIKVACSKEEKNVNKISLLDKRIIYDRCNLASGMIESNNEIYFLDNLKPNEVMKVKERVTIEIRLKCSFSLNDLKEYIITKPKDLSKYCKIEYLEQRLTTQHNVIFPGFKINISSANPYKSFSVIINEGMVSEGIISNENILIEPIIMNFMKY